MKGTSDSRRGRKPIIDAGAKVAMLAALREGRRLEEVADAYGVTVQAFYRARKRDPVFEAGWRLAHAASAEAERRSAGPSTGLAADDCFAAGSGSRHAPGMPTRLHPLPRAELGEDEPGEERIVSNNRRVYQRRRMRNVRFDEKRQQIFLAHFSWSCDIRAAAAAAGVCEGTVYLHLRKNSVFAAGFREALGQGYVLLEAEALRQRLAAQQALRAAIESAAPGSEGGARALLSADVAAEFERVMKLLARWDRRDGSLGRRSVGHQHLKPMTFEDAMHLLERRLRALNIPVRPYPHPAADGKGDP